MRRAKERNPRVLTERSQAERGEIRERERSERSDRGGGGGGGVRRRNWKPWSIERQWLEQPWRREQSFSLFYSKKTSHVL